MIHKFVITKLSYSMYVKVQYFFSLKFKSIISKVQREKVIKYKFIEKHYPKSQIFKSKQENCRMKSK